MARSVDSVDSVMSYQSFLSSDKYKLHFGQSLQLINKLIKIVNEHLICWKMDMMDE